VCEILAIFPVVSGFQAFYQIVLTKKGMYRYLAVTEIIANVSGLAVVVSLAYVTRSWLALVVQLIFVPAFLLLLRAGFSGWLPKSRFRLSVIRPTVEFGKFLTLGHVGSLISTNVDNFSLAFFSSPTAVGFYSRGFQLTMSPIAQFLAPLGNLAVNVFAKEASGGVTVEKSTFSAFRSLSFVFGTVVTIAVAVIGPLLPLLIGSNWSGIPKIVDGLLLAAIMQIFSAPLYWGMIASGDSAGFAKFNFKCRIPLGLLVVLGAWMGAQWVPAALSVSLLIGWHLNVVFFTRTTIARGAIYFREAWLMFMWFAAVFCVLRFTENCVDSALIKVGLLVLEVLAIGTLMFKGKIFSNMRKDFARIIGLLT
jgi:O-antigen/teichoic acid export membrane protein